MAGRVDLKSGLDHRVEEEIFKQEVGGDDEVIELFLSLPLGFQLLICILRAYVALTLLRLPFGFRFVSSISLSYHP